MSDDSKMFAQTRKKHGLAATVIVCVTSLPFVLLGVAVGLIFALPGLLLAGAFSAVHRSCRDKALPTEQTP